MISRLEAALARVIDGGVASVFRLRVQPAEIGRRLEHALLASRKTSMGHALGANAFTVALNPSDYASFEGWEAALTHELEAWLGEVAYQHGISTTAPMQVTVVADPEVRRRDVRVIAEIKAADPAARSVEKGVARLIPISSRDPIFVMQYSEVLVGRAESNDLVINAPEVSRQHARLARDSANLAVEDLGSRNGTWINGQRVSNGKARSGDEIAFGTVRFRLDLP